jgi:hypothetical protein
MQTNKRQLLGSSFQPLPRESSANNGDDVVGKKSLETTINGGSFQVHDDDTGNYAPPPVLVPPCSVDANFVNVFMLINPTKKSVIVPEQILSYAIGSVASRTIVVGPAVIDLDKKGWVIEEKTTPTNNVYPSTLPVYYQTRL